MKIKFIDVKLHWNDFYLNENEERVNTSEQRVYLGGKSEKEYLKFLEENFHQISEIVIVEEGEEELRV